MSVETIDHVARAISRLCEQFRDKPNILALLSALVTPAIDLEAAFLQLLTERTVDTAQGAQLDVLGKLVGQPRNGLGDEDFRRYIRARIAMNQSDGLTEDLLTVARLVINDDAAAYRLDNQGIAALVLRIDDIDLPNDLANIVISFLRDTVAAGVRIILELSPGGDDDDLFTLAQAAFVAVPIGAGEEELLVYTTAGFPATGTLLIDQGTANEEEVVYAGVTESSFLVPPLAHAHGFGASVTLIGGPDVGLGDVDDSTAGGMFSDARDRPVFSGDAPEVDFDIEVV